MNGVNKVILLGTVGQDPKLKHTQGGQAILELRLATTEKWKDATSGQMREETQWHACTMWGKRAESLARFIVKGDQLYVEGSIVYRTWNDKDGNKRYATDIRVADIELLGGNKGGGPRQGRQSQQEPDPFGPETHVGGNDGVDDPIPF